MRNIIKPFHFQYNAVAIFVCYLRDVNHAPLDHLLYRVVGFRNNKKLQNIYVYAFRVAFPKLS